MGLESATYISDLSASNPTGGDNTSQGDDHIRLLKSVAQTTFPNADKPFRFPDALAKSVNYTILSTDENKLIFADATSAGFNLTLPTLTSAQDGWQVRVIKIDSSANAVTIVGTVNGDADGLAISTQYQAVLLEWNGSAWYAYGFLVLSDQGIPTFGALTLSGLLTLSSTSHFIIPKGTTAQRPGSPATGHFRFNTSLAWPEWYTGSAWAKGGAELGAGHLFGLGLSNDSGDTTNDIGIAVGRCRDSTNAFDIVLSSALIKQLDSSFTAGTNQGGRSSSSLADGTWHIFAIMKADFTADVMFHDGLDPSAVLPSGYVYYRRIGSIVRASSTILQFTQSGDHFQLKTPILDVDVTNPGTSAVTRTLSVPNGLSLLAEVNLYLADGNGNAVYCYLSDLNTTDLAPSLSVAPLATLTAMPNLQAATKTTVRTSTAKQIRSRITGVLTAGNLRIATLGWWDTRGREAA